MHKNQWIARGTIIMTIGGGMVAVSPLGIVKNGPWYISSVLENFGLVTLVIGLLFIFAVSTIRIGILVSNDDYLASASVSVSLVDKSYSLLFLTQHWSTNFLVLCYHRWLR